MVGGIITIILTGLISFFLIGELKARNKVVNVSLLQKLFFYHIGLALVYYMYALFNPSDSNAYFFKIVTQFRGSTWGSYYGTSTTFIEFLGYPFVHFLNFNYESCMALFAFFGYLGFVFFYIFFRENIKFEHKFLGLDLLTIFMLLPNLHFWSSSLGKGSVIFMGIGLFFFGISRIQSRWFAILLGGFIIYHVRPHIMLVILVSSAIGFMFSTKGVSILLRVLFLIAVSVVFYIIFSDVLKMVGIDEEELLTNGLDLSNRARELTNATSGVDINSYSLPVQVFTFLYRPLFFDGPGILGFIVSMENVFYLIVTLRILNSKGIKFLFTGNALIKTAFLSFITASIALAQISGNLGLAIRQKSQIFILLLFVILSFEDIKTATAVKRAEQARVRKKRGLRSDREQPAST